MRPFDHDHDGLARMLAASDCDLTRSFACRLHLTMHLGEIDLITDHDLAMIQLDAFERRTRVQYQVKRMLADIVRKFQK